MAKLFGALRRVHQTIKMPPVVVIGLGRFGSALAYELMEHGVEVLGIDAKEKVAREHAPFITEMVTADSTDPEALLQLGLGEVERAVVAIGSDLEASILTASALVEVGVRDIWAKADTASHARILQQVGVHHVIRPERDTGRRVAHLLGGKFEEFAEISEGYGVTKMAVPECIAGQQLNLEDLWNHYGVQIVSYRKKGGTWAPAVDGQELESTDFVVAAGSPIALEQFIQNVQSRKL